MIARRTTYRIVLLACTAALLALVAPAAPAQSGPEDVRIGVLAYRGAPRARQMWDKTAEYLSLRIPGHRFTIVPLDFHEIGPAVGRSDVAFVITNTSMYVELESRYGVSRIATLKNRRNSEAFTEFGGVIFCRADRTDIHTLEDLRGRSFMAVEETSLGGWRAAWREFKAQGVDPYSDFSNLSFSGTHDAVVYAVRDGKVDAGTVRTDTLTRMRQDGLIDRSHYRILNPKNVEGFPFALSTRLYPEWPIARVRSTPQDLSEKVVIALLSMPHDDPAAKAAQIAGWTIPLDYAPVHELLKELRLDPYRDYGKVTLSGALRAYWYWILLAGLLVLAAMATAFYVLRLNTQLQLSQQTLRKAQDNLENTVKERTAALLLANEELERAIAERVRSEGEKARLQEQLLQTQKMEAIGILAGGIAHDFNNILSAIVGYASILRKKMTPDDPLLPNATQILAASDRATRLIKGLLAFSRKDAVALRPVDLNDIVRGFEKMLVRIIGEDIEFMSEPSPARLVVEADRGQLEQVLMNLATNARDAMPGGGALRITTERIDLAADLEEVRHGSYALLTVSDNGMGIGKDAQAHVFEPFYTTKEVGKGTGLGLAIAYGIVTKHNGSIRVSSEVGRGTTVRIYLPLTGRSVRNDQQEQRKPAPSGTETVLLVEDDLLVREVTRSILTEHGYAVLEAVDGEDAVRKFRENQDRVDLVIFDMIMPKMNGREACREFRKIRPGIRTIFISGYTANVMARRGIEEEDTSFLSKPLDPHELLTTVRMVLDE